MFLPSNFKPKTGAPPKLGSIISETRCSLGPALIVQICHRDVGLASCKVNIHLISCCAVDQEGGSLERVDNVGGRGAVLDLHRWVLVPVRKVMSCAVRGKKATLRKNSPFPTFQNFNTWKPAYLSVSILTYGIYFNHFFTF